MIHATIHPNKGTHQRKLARPAAACRAAGCMLTPRQRAAQLTHVPGFPPCRHASLKRRVKAQHGSHAPEARLARKISPAHVPQMGRCSAANCRSSGMRPQRSATSAIVVLSPPAKIIGNGPSSEQSVQVVGCLHAPACGPATGRSRPGFHRPTQHSSAAANRLHRARLSPGMIRPATDCSSSLVRTCRPQPHTMQAVCSGQHGTATAAQHQRQLV